MNEIEIKKHNFENAKKRIGNFKLSNNENSFERVKEKSFWGCFNHGVTGLEMNQYIDKVQSAFIGVNKYIYDIVKEFKEIYNALDALDKEYINGIIKSLEKAQKAITENNDTVKNLEETVNYLLKIEENIEVFKQDIANLNNNITTQTSRIANIKLQIERLENANIKNNENFELLKKEIIDIKQNIKKSKLDIFFDSLYYKISIGIFATSSFVISLILLFSK